MGSFLPQARVEGLFRLWAEAYEHADPRAARRHVAVGLRDLLGGRLVLMCVVRDLRGDGAALMTEEVHSGFESAAEGEALLEAYRQATRDPGIVAMLGERAPAVTRRRRDLVADGAWYRSEFVNEWRLRWGLDDVIYGHRQLAADTTIGIGVNREPGDRPFSEEDRDLLGLFTGQSACLYRDLRDGGAAIFAGLSRRERETLDLLLGGLSEKQVAARLDVSVNTVHTYVKSLYRRLGVRSRGELLALMLRR